MTTTYIQDFPRGTALADEIAAIEMQSMDEQIRRTLQERIAMADAHDAKFIPHEEVFAKSRAALLAKLSNA
jgi:hypothetical protein